MPLLPCPIQEIALNGRNDCLNRLFQGRLNYLGRALVCIGQPVQEGEDVLHFALNQVGRVSVSVDYDLYVISLGRQ